MINLFIDANILLNFYRLSDTLLDKIEHMYELSRSRHIKLFLGGVIVDEFKRNREKVIRKTFDKYLSSPDQITPSVLCNEYSEIHEIGECLTTLYQLLSNLTGKIQNDITKQNLKADRITNKLFTINKISSVTKKILDKARLRSSLGNPPGKRYMHGDTINWEYLLEKIPNKEDLYIISNDSDFKSYININNFSHYLEEEWTNNKNSKIFFYTSISLFLKDKFPEAINITDKDVDHELLALADKPGTMT